MHHRMPKAVLQFANELNARIMREKRTSCPVALAMQATFGTINASEKQTSCPVALAMQATLAPSMHHRMLKAVLQFANELSSMPEICKKN